MNYYQQLLDSYSQLKKRSLKLLREQGQVVSSAKDVVAAGMQSQGAYTKLAHPDGKKSVSVTLATNKQGVSVVKARFGTHQAGTPIADGTGNSPGYLAQGLGELERWLQGNGEAPPKEKKGKKSEEEEKTEKDAEAQTAKDDAELGKALAAEEEAQEAQKKENERQLGPGFAELGVGGDDPNTPVDDEQPDNKEDWNAGGDQERLDLTEDLTQLKKEWIEDTSLPLERKMEALNNIKECISALVEIDKLEKEDAPDADLASKLRTIRETMAETGRGELALANPIKGTNILESEILLFGKKDKKARSYLSKIKRGLNKGIDRYNQLAEVTSDELIQKKFDRIQVERSGTPGSDVNKRSKLDEGLTGAAGTLHALGLGIVGHDISPEKKQFLIDKLREDVAALITDQSLEDVAGFLRTGLQTNEGEGISTLLSEEAGEFTEALQNRLTSMFGEEFPAKEFIKDLADSDAQKAVALVLALRSESVQEIFGDIQSEFSIVMGQRGEGKKGRKVDNGMVFDPSKNKDLADRFNSQLGQSRAASHYMETKSIKWFMERGLMEEKDFPPDHFDPETGELDTSKEVTLVRMSLKIHNNHNSDSSQGSTRASSMVPEGAEPPERGSYEAHIQSTVKEATPKGSKLLNNFLDQIRPIVWHEGLTSRQQNEKLWEQVKKQKFDSPQEREDFNKALAIHTMMTGGGSRAPQLNIVSYMGEGDYTIQDDHKFTKDFIKNIQDGSWTVDAPEGNGDSSIIYIRNKEGKTLIKLNGSGKRTDIWKMSRYQKEVLDKQQSKPKTREGMELLKTFLNAQAKMIQEVLASE